jgi:hypothetical protein
MSQTAVEQILGRLLTDGGFRERFFSTQMNTPLSQYPLSDTEKRALNAARLTLQPEQLEQLELLLDPAICRAELPFATGHVDKTPVSRH